MTSEKSTGLNATQGPGQVFIQAREALAITQAETADVLNLSVSVIRALENNDDSALPERVYVNGYIRSYAKLLGLAADPLIQAWGAQFPDEMQSQRADQDEEEARNWSVVATDSASSRGLGRWVLAAIIASLVFISFVSNQDSADNAVANKPAQLESSIVADEVFVGIDLAVSPEVETQPADESSANLVETVESLSEVEEAVAVEATTQEVAAPVIAEVETINVEAPSPEQNAADNRFSDEQENSTEIPPTSKIIEATTPAIDVSAEADVVTTEILLPDSSEAEPEPPAFSLPRLTLEGDDRIVLAFTDECWFEIRTVDGDMLHADLGRPEQVREYFGQGPFAIKLGFAQGASLEFNGSNVALSPHTRNDVANLVVGQ
jgi:cytoskeleton protein RodZ